MLSKEILSPHSLLLGSQFSVDTVLCQHEKGQGKLDVNMSLLNKDRKLLCLLEYELLSFSGEFFRFTLN